MTSSKIVYIHSFSSDLGRIHTAYTDAGVAIITLPSDSAGAFEDRLEKYFGEYEIIQGGKLNQEVEKQLRLYFNGKLKKFNLRLDIKASPFQTKVLRTVAKVPYGKTESYGQIAARVGSPLASRAVGTANACNNLPIVIPCHRVVASNGLGGYGGGIEMKKTLLRLEGAL
ncbi:MAG: methylated-DNA--[protein]-cysteine S-methyltransferase [candidate division Zixibacteria bacterium]|nr:methylated-DNA--[protein]-cysteine S-methyltransferase [candidate division Zixibacteria bacterium]